LTPKVLDEACKLAIVWCKPHQLLSVFEGSSQVSRITAEGYERQQDVAIIRMLC
jgi:hypothetical protein